jgi:hypothetical protein
VLNQPKERTVDCLMPDRLPPCVNFLKVGVLSNHQVVVTYRLYIQAQQEDD